MNKYLLIDDKRLSDSKKSAQASEKKKISNPQVFAQKRPSFADRSPTLPS